MKTNKSKPQKKAAKKAVKKEIEKSLTDKFIEAVKSLGHDAEHIAEDIARASKVAAKKLSKKFGEVKMAVENKIEGVSNENEPKATKKKLDKKVSSKVKKADQTVTKIVKTATAKKKPVVGSVKMGSSSVAEKAAPVAQPVVEDVSSKAKVMRTKTADQNSTEKKSIVKAVTNNPVKKVAPKSIPTKKEGSTTKK